MKRARRLSAYLLGLLLLLSNSTCWFGGQDSGTQAARVVVTIYQAAITAGHKGKTLHEQGQLSDESYRDMLHALGDTRQILREATDQLADLKVIDLQNKPLVIDVLNRAADSLTRLSATGALHIKNETSRREFQQVVAVGVNAAVTILNLITALKKPVRVPPVPELHSTEIQSFLSEVN